MFHDLKYDSVLDHLFWFGIIALVLFTVAVVVICVTEGSWWKARQESKQYAEDMNEPSSSRYDAEMDIMVLEYIEHLLNQ